MPFVAHPSVRSLLEAAMGQQRQLRSMRCYTNPGAYDQEWHLIEGSIRTRPYREFLNWG
jgi:hypothetical protein